MEFGKLQNLESVDWSLAHIDPLTSPKSTTATKFWIGTPAWGRKEWVGRLYPPNTPATKFLTYYAKNFNTIELNTTHYRIPTEEQVKKWRAQVPKDFLFCPKIFKGISHEPHGLVDPDLLKEWCKSLNHFGGNLGPCFLQLSPHFDYQQKASLFRFLENWPREFALALEFRHASWFTPARHILPPLNKYLQSKNIGLVITDVAGRRDLSHGSISASFTMIRFIGNDLHPSDFSRLRNWAQTLKDWQTHHYIKDIYFFIHEPDDLKTPEMADEVLKEFKKTCHVDLPPLQWVTLPGFL